MSLFCHCSHADPWILFVPDLVRTLMCAPLLLPCDASYMAAFTAISWIASTGGVGGAWPMAPYTEVLLCSDPPAPKLSPVLNVKRFSPTWLVEFPLNRLLVLMPFSEKLLLVSRFPFAKMA